MPAVLLVMSSWPPTILAQEAAEGTSSPPLTGVPATEQREPLPSRAMEVGHMVSAEVQGLELFTTEGLGLKLSSLRRANGLLLIFAANTCPYVLDWLDRLPRLAAQGNAEEVAVVVVNANAGKRSSSDSPQAMAALWQRQGLQLPYLVDRRSALAEALGARRTPEVFLFDGAWRLVYRGAIDDLSGPFEQVTAHYAAEALGQMLSGEAVTLSQTQAIGCAIQKPRRRRQAVP